VLHDAVDLCAWPIRGTGRGKEEETGQEKEWITFRDRKLYQDSADSIGDTFFTASLFFFATPFVPRLILSSFVFFFSSSSSSSSSSLSFYLLLIILLPLHL